MKLNFLRFVFAVFIAFHLAGCSVRYIGPGGEKNPYGGTDPANAEYVDEDGVRYYRLNDGSLRFQPGEEYHKAEVDKGKRSENNNGIIKEIIFGK